MLHFHHWQKLSLLERYLDKHDRSLDSSHHPLSSIHLHHPAPPVLRARCVSDSTLPLYRIRPRSLNALLFVCVDVDSIHLTLTITYTQLDFMTVYAGLANMAHSRTAQQIVTTNPSLALLTKPSAQLQKTFSCPRPESDFLLSSSVIATQLGVSAMVLVSQT